MASLTARNTLVPRTSDGSPTPPSGASARPAAGSGDNGQVAAVDHPLARAAGPAQHHVAQAVLHDVVQAHGRVCAAADLADVTCFRRVDPAAEEVLELPPRLGKLGVPDRRLALAAGGCRVGRARPILAGRADGGELVLLQHKRFAPRSTLRREGSLCCCNTKSNPACGHA